MFSPEQKNIVYDKSDLLSIYIHRKGTWEDPCYFNEELSSKDDDSDKKIEDNKVDKENKKNILNSEPPKVLASNKAV